MLASVLAPANDNEKKHGPTLVERTKQILRKRARGHKTRYIRASTAPFNDEMVIDEIIFMKWLDTMNVTYDSEVKDCKKLFTRRHLSGHASKTELEELIKKINPDKIIPIHTEHSNEFEQLFPGKVQVPTHGQVLNL